MLFFLCCFFAVALLRELLFCSANLLLCCSLLLFCVEIYIAFLLCCFFAYDFGLLFCVVALLRAQAKTQHEQKSKKLSKQQSNTSNKATEQAIGCFFACEQQFFCVSHPALESSFRNKTGIQPFLCFNANLWASHQSDCCSRDWQRQTFFLIRNKFSKSLFLGSFETETVKLNHLFPCQSLQYRENF